MKPSRSFVVSLSTILAVFIYFFFYHGWNRIVFGGNQTEAGIVTVSFHQLASFKGMVANQYLERGKWPESLPPRYQTKYFDLSFPHDHVMKLEFKSESFIPIKLAGKSVEYKFNERNRYWQCTNGSPGIPEKYLPINCLNTDGSAVEPLPSIFSFGFVWFLLILTPIVGYFYVAKDPRLVSIAKNPEALRSQKVGSIKKIGLLLKLIGRLDSTLSAAKISQYLWKGALEFSELNSNRRSSILARRLQGTDKKVTGWQVKGNVYEWDLSESREIPIPNCLVLFPDNEIPKENLTHDIKKAFQGNEVVLIIETDEEKNGLLLELASDVSNRFVVPSEEELTTWLLDYSPSKQFLSLLKTQLLNTRISPYQTRGGIENPSQFFGRRKELSQILNSELKNYILVGGRQLGKTSLLKRVGALFKENPGVQCHYLSLRDHRLPQRLASYCSLEKKSSLASSVSALRSRSSGSDLVLLIDESDLFIKHDAELNYPILQEIRSLSDEGKCHFIFAGFWELYSSAILDYQSPIRNFGEVIKVGRLSKSNCIEMAEKPMALLGLTYANSSFPKVMASELGYRANLVAIACQYCIDNLPSNVSEFSRELVVDALKSDQISDALSGWTRLTSSEEACRIDRIIIYIIASRKNCELKDIVDYFKNKEIRLDIEDINLSIRRLKLAYIIRQKDEVIQFTVPIFAKQFNHKETTLLLEEESAGLSASELSK